MIMSQGFLLPNVMADSYRIGQIVPNSNVTMETEVPAMLGARPSHYEESFTSTRAGCGCRRSRSRNWNGWTTSRKTARRCFRTPAATSSRTPASSASWRRDWGYHEESEAALREKTVENDTEASVVTSASALFRALERLEAEQVTLIAPYMKELTQTVRRNQ